MAKKQEAKGGKAKWNSVSKVCSPLRLWDLSQLISFFIFMSTFEQQGGCGPIPIVLSELTAQFMKQLWNEKCFFSKWIYYVLLCSPSNVSELESKVEWSLVYSLSEAIGMEDEVYLRGICLHTEKKHVLRWQTTTVPEYKAVGMGCWDALLEAELPCGGWTTLDPQRQVRSWCLRKWTGKGSRASQQFREQMHGRVAVFWKWQRSLVKFRMNRKSTIGGHWNFFYLQRKKKCDVQLG